MAPNRNIWISLYFTKEPKTITSSFQDGLKKHVNDKTCAKKVARMGIKTPKSPIVTANAKVFLDNNDCGRE